MFGLKTYIDSEVSGNESDTIVERMTDRIDEVSELIDRDDRLSRHVSMNTTLSEPSLTQFIDIAMAQEFNWVEN